MDSARVGICIGVDSAIDAGQTNRSHVLREDAMIYFNVHKVALPAAALRANSSISANHLDSCTSTFSATAPQYFLFATNDNLRRSKSVSVERGFNTSDGLQGQLGFECRLLFQLRGPRPSDQPAIVAEPTCSR